MHLRPSVAECRIAHVRGLRHDAAAEYSQDHPHPDLESHPACAPVAGHVPPVAVKGGKLVVRSLPVPRLGPSSLRVEVVHLVCLLGSAARLPRTLEALPLIRAVHRLWVCLAQMVTVKHRLLVLSCPGPRVRVCLAYQAQSARRSRPESVDSRRQPVVRCHLHVRPRELAVECSLGFLS